MGSAHPKVRLTHIFLLAGLIITVWPLVLFAQSIQFSEDEGPITITSLQLELDHQSQEVVFSGNVEAIQGETIITCNEMRVFYTSSKEEDKDKEKITEIHATGNVLMVQGDRTVRGEKAVYYHDEGKVIVTGDPSFTEGQQEVKGNKITFFLDGKRFLVEGDAGSPVKAVIYPGETG